jgi:uncharacterized protein
MRVARSPFAITWSLRDEGYPEAFLIFNSAESKTLISTAAILGELREGRSIELGHDPPESLQTLLDHGVLVPEERDLFGEYLDRFEVARRKSSHLFPVITVTTACNLRCLYCYEAGIKPRTMDPDTVEATLRWLDERAAHPYVRHLSPTLFGGEPMLVVGHLERMLDGIGAIRERHGLGGETMMSSNGLLLDRTTARRLADRGLRTVQISLDGPEEIHDRRRIDARGHGHFRKILSIVEEIHDLLRVCVKVNLDAENLPALRSLFELLAERELTPHITVKLELVAPPPNPASARVSEQLLLQTEPSTADAYLDSFALARELGVRITRDTTHSTPCMAHVTDGVAIGPNGALYKCVSLVGRREFQVGHVSERGFRTESHRAQLDYSELIRECVDQRCAYLPVCMGGCPYEAWVLTGSARTFLCRRSYLERLYRGLLWNRSCARVHHLLGQGSFDSGR